MAQKNQRGWLKKESRAQGETWVLFFRTTRKSDGKREHRTGAAIQMCQNAISRIGPARLTEYQTELAAAQENLKFLTHSAGNSKPATDTPNAVIRDWTFKLPRFLSGTESGEFFVLVSSDPKTRSFRVVKAKFISGSEKMKFQGKQLKNIDPRIPAPGDTAAQFVWRGILGCYEYTGCSFVVLDPAGVRSLK